MENDEKGGDNMSHSMVWHSHDMLVVCDVCQKNKAAVVVRFFRIHTKCNTGDPCGCTGEVDWLEKGEPRACDDSELYDLITVMCRTCNSRMFGEVRE